MAKYFGISGKRLGSVGNETYDIVNRQNIVKTKVIDPKYSNTRKQVSQRAKFLDCFNMVKTIGSNYMEKAFNNRKRKESVYNVFMKNNVGQALMISPKDNEDPNMIGFGDFLVSKGNLQNLDYTVLDNKCGIGFISSSKNIANVGTLSGILRTYYPFLQEGDYINFYNFACTNLNYSNDAGDPISITDNIDIIKTYKNFKVDSTSNETLADKGFVVLEEENDNRILTLKQPGEAAAILDGCKKDYNGTSVSYFFIARQLPERIITSDSIQFGNTDYDSICAGLATEESINRCYEEWKAQASALIVNDEDM
jgi:hypothetical protein